MSADSHPCLCCWFCGVGLELDQVLGVGILRSRTEERGGPYRLFSCPSCGRANRCERTGGGRWFSSPTFRPNLLEYLFGRLLTASPEDFLQAVSWYRDNEERRRYFFERDGDRRYSSTGLLWKLWPGRAAAAGASGARHERARADGDDERRRARHGRPGREEPRRREPPGKWRPGVVTPWEILGLPENAGEAEIRRAFHRLAVAYHPDKVHHLGEEFRRVAHRKFTELKRAYEELMSRKGG